MKKNKNKRRNPFSNIFFSGDLSFKKFPEMISSAVQERKKESPEERKDDIKALIITAVIVTILIFVFWKVPFLHKYIFP